jgi:hypothetical protein
MTDDKTLEEFFEMFPNCPNPEHQPMIVRHLVEIFKHVNKAKEIVVADNEVSEEDE